MLSHIGEERSARCRGSSLLELALVMVIIPFVLGIGIVSLRSSSAMGGDVMEASVSMDKLRALLRRIGDEVVCSGQAGEDQNRNGAIDVAEDINGNGRLEADWAVTSSSIRFNRVLADGTFSLPITYALVDGRLVRTERQPDGASIEAVIAGRVLGFSVIASGPQITISLSLGSDKAPQSSSISVRQRN